MTNPRTLNELYFGALDRFGSRPVAMRTKATGAWTDLSYADLRDRVQDLALGFKELGIGVGERVGLLSENRPEWAIADYASLTACCVDVPIYPTLPPKHVEYILRDSGAAAVCISTQTQLDKVLEARGRLPALQHIIVFDRGLQGAGVMHLDEVCALGRAARDRYPSYREGALGVGPDDLATLIYTSGTTGDPKGVMLTHGNITSNVVATLQVLELTDSDECLSFLPLSHIFERMSGHYTMFHSGVIINYATSIETVAVEMGEVKPTVMIAVPRLYEKIYARVLENALSGSGVKKAIFFWAKRNAERWADLMLEGRPIPGSLAAKKAIGDKLVFSKLRARTGGRIKFFCSGGAPLNAEIAKFFFAAGLPVLEGYGLTETSPVITVNRPNRIRWGWVGEPIPGVEVRIAADGEILTRGPHVMKGYYHKPEATAEAIDAEGWFHTGDIGTFEGGFLKITDRKKDLIVTAGGKNIAPQPIENVVKTNKFVSNAVMLGDRRRFPIMLIVPNAEPLAAWAKHKQLVFGSTKELLALPEVGAKMEREVRKMLRDLAQYETPKKLLLIEQDFTVDGGELTPKLSVRRHVVEQRYRDRIEALYADVPPGSSYDGSTDLAGSVRD